MIYIQSAFSQEEQRLELVGRQGEGGTRQLVFDCADVLAEYPYALIVCAMQRTGDRTAYLKDCATAGTNRAVTLESADVAVPGVLKIELRALIGDDVRKSAVYIAKVAESLRGAQDRPGNPIADVLNRIDMTISRAEESIAEADAAAKSAQTVADTVQAKLDNGDFVGPAGKDGANGKDGAPGKDGKDGEPGSDASVTADNIQSALGYTPVKDVQVAGRSVLDGGVAKVPIASATRPGVIRVGNAQNSGIYIDQDGNCYISYATTDEIKERTAQRKTIVCSNLDYAVKSAMCDGKGAAWTDAEQKAAQERMGIDKPYELIEEIVLEDGVAAIFRSPFSYSCTSVLSCVTFPVMDSSISFYMEAHTDTNISYVVGNTYGSPSGSVEIRLEETVKNGALTGTAQGMVHGLGSGTVYGVNNAALLVFCEAIIGVRFYTANSGKNIPAGTKIKIYGVRAQ